MRLDIGIASYGAPNKLQRTIDALQIRSKSDYRVFVIDNPHPDQETREQVRDVITRAAAANGRFVPVFLDQNVGYAGAVCKLMELAETEYIAYVDNDATILTMEWDRILAGYLDRFHEIGMIFPNGGAYMIDRGPYQEIMWGVGFCWMLSRMCMKATGPLDTSLGHQEEADYCLRVRMAGWKCAAAPDVAVAHDATATNSPKSIERISAGVVNWVNKWCAYFGGKNLNYHSPNVLRWEDWPPNALYLEEYYRRRLPGLNDNPEVIKIDGREYDLIRVPRFKDFYRGRII